MITRPYFCANAIIPRSGLALILVLAILLFICSPPRLSIASDNCGSEDRFTAAAGFALDLITTARWRLRLLDEEFRRLQSTGKPLSPREMDELNARGVEILEAMLEAYYFLELRYTVPADRQQLIDALTGPQRLRHLPYNFYTLHEAQPIQVSVGPPRQAQYPPGTVIYVPLWESDVEDAEPVAYWLLLVGGPESNATWEDVARKFEGNTIPKWRLPGHTFSVEYQGKAL